MKMHDMGRMESFGIAVSEKDTKKKKYYETIRVNESQLPDIKNCIIGQEIMLKIECRVKSINIDDDKKTNITLEIREAGIMDNDKPKSFIESSERTIKYLNDKKLK